jgi:hypothetical protein
MEDAVDRSKVNHFISEIMKLSDQEQIAIAKKVVRTFDPIDKEQFIPEFEEGEEGWELRQARLQATLRGFYLVVGAALLALCLWVVVLTARDAPDQVDKVIGTITTIAGLVGGFIGGKYGGPATQGKNGNTE